MDLDRDAIPAFRDAFNEVARGLLGPEDLRPVLRPDVAIGPEEVDLELLHWLAYLGPHGIGNPGPLFLASGVRLERSRAVGEGHLKVTLRTGSSRLDAIGFGLAARHPPESLDGGPHDVLFRLERNEWRGSVRPQALLADLRPSAAP
jgi:single-stranded-DNA-specific exonuclease